MSTKFDIDYYSLKELNWQDFGQASLSGSLLRLYRKIDELFLSWADALAAEEYCFPPFISAAQMAKLDYFNSFPHLLTMPVTLEDDLSNLESFAADAIGSDGALKPGRLAPVKQVLTPAACYHFYDELQSMALSSGKYLTTKTVCFRRETSYSPLQRQWAFSMREIVCISGIEEVQKFLRDFEELLLQYFASRAFPVQFEYANDPFFKPASNPKYLAQKLEPVKKEMIYDGRLSIGSLNFHRNFFGENFEINYNGAAAYSACVAFGLERWIYMILQEQGLNEKDWSF